MTNGQPVRVRAAMKPISTVPRALATVDMATGDEAVAIHQRSDVCAVPAAGVVVETMVALVLARAALEKFGGDSLAETRTNIDGYLRACRREPPRSRTTATRRRSRCRRRADGSESGAGGDARAPENPRSGAGSPRPSDAAAGHRCQDRSRPRAAASPKCS